MNTLRSLQAAAALVLCLGPWSQALAQGSWVSLQGPYGGRVSAIAVDPAATRRVLVSTAFGGLWRSEDGGQTFRPADRGLQGWVRQIAFARQEPEVVYVITTRWHSEQGLYLSTDGGASWTQIALSGEGCTTLIERSGSPEAMLVGCRGGLVVVEERGDRLSRVEGLRGTILDLVRAPSRPGTLYAAAEGLFRSRDDGLSWEEVGEGPPGLRLVSVAVDPSDGEVVFGAAERSSRSFGGVFRSDDGGRSFRLTQPGCTREVRFGPSGALFAVPCDGGRITRSIDGGETWETLPIFDEAWRGGDSAVRVAFDPDDEDRLYVGFSNRGLYRSTDGGRRWSVAALPAATVTALLIHPEDPLEILAGTSGIGLWRTADGGRSWAESSEGFDGLGGAVRALARDPERPTTLYLGSRSGLFKSTDGGESWGATGLDPALEIADLQLSPSAPERVWVSVTNPTWGKGVWISRDGGESFRRSLEILAPPSHFATPEDPLATHPADGDVAYVGFTSVSGEPLQLLRTIDGGESWELVHERSAGAVQDIAIDPRSPEIVYAATRPEGLLRSVDGGETFFPVSTGGRPLVDRIAIDPRDPLCLTLSTADGLTLSSDGGESWHREALTPPGLATLLLGIDEEGRSVTYASRYGRGLFADLVTPPILDDVAPEAPPPVVAELAPARPREEIAPQQAGCSVGLVSAGRRGLTLLRLLRLIATLWGVRDGENRPESGNLKNGAAGPSGFLRISSFSVSPRRLETPPSGNKPGRGRSARLNGLASARTIAATTGGRDLAERLGTQRNLSPVARS